MANIRVLDKQVAEQIAAGEVIERPASVVKELVENAIDAGATTITVEIRRGGVTFLRVTDNGKGIEPDDVPTAFLRHATSKVQTSEDLDTIFTLGFRGEALASICAVSKVELLTKTAGQQNGTRYVVHGGEEVFRDEAGCPDGTTVVVRDIFYNVPARMKFLKKDVTEANAIASIVDKMALANEQISFRLINNGTEKLFTPGDSNPLSAVYAVFGREFAGSLVKVDYEENGLRVHGFISRPSASRPNRRMQHFFINRRYIKSQVLMASLEEAYKHAIMVGKFPACVLNIEIPPNTVDVNVHPAKLEVRFADERRVFQLLYAAVRNTLMSAEDHVPIRIADQQKAFTSAQPKAPEQLHMTAQAYKEAFGAQPAEKPRPSCEPAEDGSVIGQRRSQYEAAIPAEKSKAQGQTILRQPTAVVYESSRSWPETAAEDAQNQQMKTEEIEWRRIEREQAASLTQPVMPMETQRTNLETGGSQDAPEHTGGSENTGFSDIDEYRVIGEAFCTYIVVEHHDELLLIDKHAAHERILYEQILEGAKEHKQVLLAPVTVSLSREEYDAAIRHLELFDEVGFETEDFGEGMLIVRSVPISLSEKSVSDIICEIADEMANHKRKILPEDLDWLYHSVACRAAIKANDRSSKLELRQLVSILKEHPDIQHCPHGRPIYLKLTQKELEKQFGRLGS
ncbi:DNA mismatch repair endonuclease MutL [Candidatus Soleaferrea massiliensis]|uniref:DNA mismatch repair endonuclease MutL n=1 Tax=Candidatus Soleaferrea massiliensis TaxID=1470354 RepID=UPI00059155A5|nr:DNA mismatch repair endonuclease MutL [Candidatus Soleaferrea massiliensis]